MGQSRLLRHLMMDTIQRLTSSCRPKGSNISYPSISTSSNIKTRYSCLSHSKPSWNPGRQATRKNSKSSSLSRTISIRLDSTSNRKRMRRRRRKTIKQKGTKLTRASRSKGIFEMMNPTIIFTQFIAKKLRYSIFLGRAHWIKHKLTT